MPVVNEVKNKLKCKFGSIKTFFACFFSHLKFRGYSLTFPNFAEKLVPACAVQEM